MVIELIFLVTTTLFVSPALCVAPTGTAIADFFSARQPSSDFNAKITKGQSQSANLESRPLVMVKHKHVIAVFIHGTLFPVPSLSAMQEWAEEKIKKDRPALSYFDLLRNKSVLRNQPIGPIGLHPVLPLWSQAATGAQLISWVYQQMYHLLPRQEYALVHPYTFGWDGSLNLMRRKAQAGQLLAALEALVFEQRQKYPHDDVEIVVLAHSHGGNVALHMADWAGNYSKIKIDHLLMFGTPIHGDTHHLPASDLFKNVYNFHSQGDYIQVADILSTKKYVPARVFSDKQVVESSKVKQVLVEVGSYAPNHSEFWFFRRPSVFFYRSSLPIAPMPIVAFAPLILHELRKTRGDEHFVKLHLNPGIHGLSLCVVPFQDYWKETLVQLHQYENNFDYSSLLSQLPLIKNE
jgi:hypothetical protein